MRKTKPANFTRDKSGKTIFDSTETENQIHCNEHFLRGKFEKFQKSEISKGWLVSGVGISFTILGTLATSSFTNAFGYPASTWSAVFIIGLFLSVAGTIVYGIKWFLKRTTVDKILDEIKSESKAKRKVL